MLNQAQVKQPFGRKPLTCGPGLRTLCGDGLDRTAREIPTAGDRARQRRCSPELAIPVRQHITPWHVPATNDLAPERNPRCCAPGSISTPYKAYSLFIVARIKNVLHVNSIYGSMCIRHSMLVRDHIIP